MVGVASLAMYPFAPLRPRWETLWTAVHRRLRGSPAALTWDDDVHRLWDDPDLFVGQACSWPVAVDYADRLRTIGTFDPRIPGARDGRYRSLVVVRRPSRPDAALPTLRDVAGARAAINARNSMSGWISLTYAVHGTAGRWDGPVLETGAHAESVVAVRDGLADVAAIDALTWALLRDLEPARLAGLAVIGRGPRIPCVPVVVPASAEPRTVAAVRRALAAACSDPATATARRHLRIRSFVPMGPSQDDPGVIALRRAGA